MKTKLHSKILTPVATLIAFLLLILSASATDAQVTNITGPVGSAAFGAQVVTLPNGNFIVADPFYSEGGVGGIGAVFLYDGATLALISKLRGGTSSDGVGNSPIVVLTGGNYFVVRTDLWNTPSGTVDVGAVTLCSAIVGCNGTVTPSNSLIGSTANDRVGDNGITPLPNGNYVVRSFDWRNGAASRAGALTFCNAATNSCANQVVSASNSLVGSTTNDVVGNLAITILANGNFLVNTPTWDNTGVIPTAVDAGALTFCSGTTGCSFVLSASNSLVGTTTGESNSRTLTGLSNGNYVLASSEWDNGAATNAGAVTFCNGTIGCTGAVSAANSLVGSTASDFVGKGGLTVLPNTPSFFDGSVTALTNGNYVVGSPNWHNGAAQVGAVTFCNGATGCLGAISVFNSLVGSTANSVIGGGVTALTNGNYVVRSPAWDREGVAFDVGAVTLCNGTIGCTGAVTVANSLTGTTGTNRVGGSPTVALENGNYVVNSPEWDSAPGNNVGAATICNGMSNNCAGVVVSTANSLTGTTNSDLNGDLISAFPNGNYLVRSPSWKGVAIGAGAITFCNSATNSCAGQAISASNSLVGSTATDNVGNGSVTTLTNGNLVIHSTLWDNTPANVNAGAFTLCDATAGCPTGVLSFANSLTGTRASEFNGGGAIALANGNYLVKTPNWNNGAVVSAGAVTWCNGITGCTGAVSAANSLFGSTTSDLLGSDSVGSTSALANGNYIVLDAVWDNPPLANAGFALYGDGANGTFGSPNALANSDRTVIGTVANGITNNQTRFDAVNNQMIVGRANSKLVTILKFPAPIFADATPPVISPNILGTLGNNDWYRSDVSISWAVTDAESSVSSQAGCDTQTITSDTAGLTFTCTATSSGGTSSQSFTVKRDTASPAISFVSRTAANANGWNNMNVTVNWSCSDATSGAANPGDSQTVSTEGQNQSSSGTCTDNAGNTASDTQTGISVDITAPTLAPIVSPNPVFLNGTATATPTATDGLSGIAMQSCEAPNTSSVGNKIVVCTATDNAGNTANADTGYQVVPPPDATPPVISPNVAGTLGNNGWYRSDITVSWTVTDAESSVSHRTGCDTITVTSDTSGLTFTCFATSSGGTTSESVTIKRDATNPNIGLVSRTPGANAGGWNNTNVTLNWSCSDATSGAVNSGDSQTVSTEGQNQGSTGTCTDNAGNTVSNTQTGISIDKTAPIISFVSRTPPANSNGWNNTNVTVNWSCSDANSGAVNPGDSQTVSTEGQNQSSTGTCTDNAGNIVSNTQTGISIDKTAPIISFVSRTPGANAGGWNNTNVTVNWSCSDATSGAVNPGDSQTVSTEGQNQGSTGTCTDKAGNMVSNTQTGISIDKTAPIISFVSRSPLANSNGWNNTNVTVNWSCGDANSGAVNPGDSQTVSTEGQNQSLTGTCTDNAGNMVSNTQTGISIDTTAPALAPTVSPNPVFLNGTATAAPNATDALSGIASQSCAATSTATLGSNTVACTAIDAAGNTANADATYQVVSNLFNFAGFFQPVENLPTVNIATAGSSISIKFSLSGDQGLNIMAPDYPASSPVPCNTNEPSAVIEETVNAGGSSLTYNATTDRYGYVWKTDKAWKGTCRIFVLRLKDGSEHLAKFSFK